MNQKDSTSSTSTTATGCNTNTTLATASLPRLRVILNRPQQETPALHYSDRSRHCEQSTRRNGRLRQSSVVPRDRRPLGEEKKTAGAVSTSFIAFVRRLRPRCSVPVCPLTSSRLRNLPKLISTLLPPHSPLPLGNTHSILA